MLTFWASCNCIGMDTDGMLLVFVLSRHDRNRVKDMERVNDGEVQQLVLP